MPVARAAELRQWIDSGEYGRILGGDYPRRDGDGNASVTEDVKAAADSYREPSTARRTRWSGCCGKLGGGAADLAGVGRRRGRRAAPTGATGRRAAGRRRPRQRATAGQRRDAAPVEPAGLRSAA